MSYKIVKIVVAIETATNILRDELLVSKAGDLAKNIKNCHKDYMTVIKKSDLEVTDLDNSNYLVLYEELVMVNKHLMSDIDLKNTMKTLYSDIKECISTFISIKTPIFSVIAVD